MSAADVLRELANWRRGCRKLQHIYRGRETHEKDSAGIEHRVYRVRQVTGRFVTVSVEEARVLRARVLRLSREALRRQRAADWAWFHWLGEMHAITRIDLLDNFDELYAPEIEKAVARKRQIKAAGTRAAEKRRAIGCTTAAKVQAGKRTVSKRHARRIARQK